jgi:hypothetical protein
MLAQPKFSGMFNCNKVQIVWGHKSSTPRSQQILSYILLKLNTKGLQLIKFTGKTIFLKKHKNQKRMEMYLKSKQIKFHL